jgi:hypothetical protein
MKTVITVEDGRITIQVESDKPVEVVGEQEKQFPAHFFGGNPVQPLSIAPAPSKKKAVTMPGTDPTRRCQVCGDDISHRSKLSQICQKPECRKAKHREANARYMEKANLPTMPKAPPKSVPNIRVKKPDGLAEVKTEMDDLRASFDDQWDCAVCRNAGSLCVMHETMAAKGEKPPKYRPTPSMGRPSHANSY